MKLTVTKSCVLKREISSLPEKFDLEEMAVGGDWTYILWPVPKDSFLKEMTTKDGPCTPPLDELLKRFLFNLLIQTHDKRCVQLWWLSIELVLDVPCVISTLCRGISLNFFLHSFLPKVFGRYCAVYEVQVMVLLSNSIQLAVLNRASFKVKNKNTD